ncbi:hypothetical protein PIB30_102202 [Stylosanthes scabra]|uniref:Uncharacterized protein n=1 Tax=Stylosanthes scabra TaxID=79078 RepID=A0ABU6QZ00_9FABA|nr:hypothetical protein [Stylosanthes scabra]
MVWLAEQRGSVELYVVHNDREEEQFSKIGYIDVLGDEVGGEEGAVEEPAADVNANVPEARDGVGQEGRALQRGGATKGVDVVEGSVINEEEVIAGQVDLNGNEEQERQNHENEDDGSCDNVEKSEESGDSEDGEYVLSYDVSDSADDVQFTDSDQDLGLDDSGFGFEAKAKDVDVIGKGKMVLNADFSGDSGEESEDMDGGYNQDEGDEDGDEVAVNMFPIHKPIEDMTVNHVTICISLFE